MLFWLFWFMFGSLGFIGRVVFVICCFDCWCEFAFLVFDCLFVLVVLFWFDYW